MDKLTTAALWVVLAVTVALTVDMAASPRDADRHLATVLARDWRTVTVRMPTGRVVRVPFAAAGLTAPALHEVTVVTRKTRVFGLTSPPSDWRVEP